MKRLCSLLLACIATLCLFGACGEPKGPVVYTVTFSQEGQTDIVKEVESGKALTDIPTPVGKDGYDVAWNTTNFSKITGNLTVTAVATPKTYVITYTYDPRLDNAYEVTLEKTTQSVVYNTQFTLATATASNAEKTLIFQGWVDEETNEPVVAGTYDFTRDITLVAQFGVADVEWS